MTREEAAAFFQEDGERTVKSMRNFGWSMAEKRKIAAYNAALSALRGPQPDPDTGLVPCGFCTNTFDRKPLLQENKYKPYTCMMSTISIEENNGKHQIEIDLWDGGNVYAAFDINYCPMCGRKLTEPPLPGEIGRDAVAVMSETKEARHEE